MKKTTKNLLSVAGVIFTVLGGLVSIPAFLQEKYGFVLGAWIFIIIGLVLLSIALGDE